MPMPRTVSTGRTLLNTPTSYLDKLRSLFGPSIVALWPQNEAAGTVSKDESGHGYNGAYTGVTLGAAGIGDGNTAASYDGTTSFNNVYSAGLAAAFNGAEATLITWLKVSGVGVYADGVRRHVATFDVDGSNQIFIYKDPNSIVVRRIAGGTSKLVSLSTTSVNWLCIAITVSESGDAVKGYSAGIQFGSTQTTIGTFAGVLASNLTNIGALATTPTNVWSGSIGPVILLNRAATAAEILQAATV